MPTIHCNVSSDDDDDNNGMNNKYLMHMLTSFSIDLLNLVVKSKTKSC
jgi:hypothetical protein